jgi:hypothetical protein
MSGTYGPESPLPSVGLAVAPRIKAAPRRLRRVNTLTRYAINNHQPELDSRDINLSTLRVTPPPSQVSIWIGDQSLR